MKQLQLMAMQITLKLSMVILFSTFNISCHGQEMVQKSGDAPDLEINKSKFVGKTLKMLLKQIKPKIESAIAREGNSMQIGFFNFYFTPKKDYDKYRSQDKFPLTIKVYVKGSFVWDRRGSTEDTRLNWSLEDEKKYGDLIIVDIKVYSR